jgi:hypothetical protein
VLAYERDQARALAERLAPDPAVLPVAAAARVPRQRVAGATA